MPIRRKLTPNDESTSEPNMKQEETFTFKATHVYAVLVVLAFSAGVLIGYRAWGRAPASVAAASAPLAVATPTLEKVTYNIPIEGFPSLGPADAPITIVEFSDFQCPYCTRWHEETFKALLNAYPGKIRFVYRNYPLSFHPNAFPGAEAALCAGDQDAYWQYHDRLFSEKDLMNNQEGTVVDVATYVRFATELGLDAATFETCLTNGTHKQAVQDDVDFANSLPTENGEAAISGTPTFFINGTRLVGAYPLPYFKQIIDAQLAALP